MSEGVNDPHQEALGEVALARLALDGDDQKHCAQHVATALQHKPTLPEAHELLSALAARRSDGGLGLFPLDGKVTAGMLVAHAHLLAAQGHPGQALHLLAQATAFNPAMPWANVGWVEEFPAGRTPAEELLKVFTTIIGGLPDEAPKPIVESAQPYLAVARRAVAAYPSHAILQGAASGVARRLGEPRLALTWAQRGVEAESNMLTEMWWANALRANGQLESAISAMQAAARHDPQNLAIQSDLALWLSQAGQHEEALAVAEAALEADPDFDCAFFTLASIRFAVDGNPDHLVAMADFAREHPDQSHEHNELHVSCRRLPWLGGPAPGTESCVNAIRGMEARYVPVEMGISTMEVPSALMTVHRAYPQMVIAMGSPAGRVKVPDPRLPLKPGVELWRFDGNEATAALPPPSMASSAAFTAQFSGGLWAAPPAMYDLAVSLSAIPVEDLLALLVHPPAVPEGPWQESPSLWERNVQAWCCVGLLHHRTEEPWPTSTRRRLLAEIVNGVEDWTTEAALFALLVMAWVDPTCRRDVASLVEARFLAGFQASQTRPVTILKSLAQLAFFTPTMSTVTRQLARQVAGDTLPAIRLEAAAPKQRRRRKSFLSRLFGSN